MLIIIFCCVAATITGIIGMGLGYIPLWFVFFNVIVVGMAGISVFLATVPDEETAK